MGRTACTEPQCLYKGALYLNFLQFYSLHPQMLERTQQTHEGMKQNSRYSCWYL